MMGGPSNNKAPSCLSPSSCRSFNDIMSPARHTYSIRAL
jgi:hypothetical protein